MTTNQAETTTADFNIENPIELVIAYTEFIAVSLHKKRMQADEETADLLGFYTSIFAGIGILLSSPGYKDTEALHTFIVDYIAQNQLLEKALTRMAKGENTND